MSISFFNTIMPRKISQTGQTINNLRKQKGLSQSRFSELADISYNSVMKLESAGITYPSIGTLQQLYKSLDISAYDLLR